MRGEAGRKFDSPRTHVLAKKVEPVAFIAGGVVIFRLKIIGHTVVVVERIAFLIVVGKISGKLIIPLKLEPVRELLVHPDGPTTK